MGTTKLNDFSHRQLSGASFVGEDLSGYNFQSCNLRGANFSGAKLIGANFRQADLREARFDFANVAKANFDQANLICASFYEASLDGASLQGADLLRVNFNRAHLNRANLSHTKLVTADLTGALMGGANLDGTSLPHFQIVPEVGQFHAYKKVRILGGDTAILELLIPKSARRTSTLVGRKCRADKAKVIRTLGLAPEDKSYICSLHDPQFDYKVGAWVKEPGYDPDIRVECTQGIHFFMTLQETMDY